MVVPIILGVLALVVVLWMATAITGILFSVLPWAVAGLLTGWAASKITGARLGVGWTILAGIAGSWLGGAVFSFLLPGNVGGLSLFNPLSLVAAVFGAAVLITFARVARPSLTGSDRPKLGRY